MGEKIIGRNIMSKEIIMGGNIMGRNIVSENNNRKEYYKKR